MNETNRTRQELTVSAIQQAIEMVEASGWKEDLLLVVHHPQWHEGILGLIAGKVTEQFGVPTLALGKSGDYYKGSARSIGSFNIIEAIKQYEDLLEEAGGHAMAAGLTIREENIDNFRQKMREYAQDFFSGSRPPQLVEAELQLPLELITMELAQKLQQFAPYGIGNPRPLFYSPQVIVLNKQLVGADAQHLKLSVGNKEGKILEAIVFGKGFLFEKLELGMPIPILYSIDIDTYFDKPRLQLKTQEILLID
jgi:single-stranded-DNA-specific exonuclease